MKHVWGYIGALAVVCIWGSTFVSSKVLLDKGLRPADIFLVRFVIAYLCMLTISHRRICSDSWHDELVFVLLGIMGGSLYFLTENMALCHGWATNVSILVSTAPLLTALVCSFFYPSERMRGWQVVGSLVAFVGVVLVVLNGQLVLHLNPLGDMLALSAALAWAFYSLLLRRIMGRYSMSFITRKIFAYGIITILPYFLLVEPFSMTATMLTDWSIVGNLLFLSVIASHGCFLLWNWVLREVGVVHASNFIYLQSLVTMAVSAIVLDERITPMAIAGAAILILGMLRALK